MVNIIIVDDHPIFCQGLASLLATQPGFTLIGEASNRLEALELLEKKRADLFIVDLSLGNDSGLDLIKDIRIISPEVRILVLSFHDELIYAIRAMTAGADGYLEKSEPPMKIIDAIYGVVQGNKCVSPVVMQQVMQSVLHGRKDRMVNIMDSLSDREFEIFNLIGKGWGSSRMAHFLGISVRTIDTHKDHLKQKLQCTDTQELRIKAINWGTETDMRFNYLDGSEKSKVLEPRKMSMSQNML